jgi:hypothetical protein
MFSRVVSNFRKKTRKIGQSKSLSSSLSSDELFYRCSNYQQIEKKVFATNSPPSYDENDENILSSNSTTCKSDAQDSTICDNNESG